MKRVVIFGITQFAEILSNFLRESDEYEVSGYVVDRDYLPESGLYNGLPVVAFDDVGEYFPANEFGMFICVGYSRMNRIRAEKFSQAKAMGYTLESYIHPTAIVLTDKLGEGTVVMEGAIIGTACQIGCGNVFLAAAHIAHHAIIGNFNFFTISTALAGNICVGNSCFFGNNCTIKNGIKISDYTFVGAGCYLSHDTEAYSVHVPARSVCLQNKSSLDMNITL